MTNIVGKKTTKPSANTRSFLQEMRKKKMQSQTADPNEDLIFVSGHGQARIPEIPEEILMEKKPSSQGEKKK